MGTNTISELATSIQELKSAETTLACLLQGMHGVRTTVELRSDAEVTGMIQSVESDMSISMVWMGVHLLPSLSNRIAKATRTL